MKRRTRGMLAVAAAGATVIAGAAFGPAAIAAPAAIDPNPAASQRLDNRPGPLTERQNERRKAAQELILSGQASPNEDGVVAARRATSTTRPRSPAPAGCSRSSPSSATRAAASSAPTPGPLHNQIPEPDRTRRQQHALDRRTSTRAYYEDLFFGDGESFADFYTKQSSGNYTVAGEVSDWVQVPGNASTYGDNTRRGLRRRVAVHRGHRQRLVRRAGRGGQVRRRDQGRARDVRRLGPLRLRRRRQLRRARRLPRPLPGRPRRRGRGRRRRRPGRGRHLVAPLVRQLRPTTA